MLNTRNYSYTYTMNEKINWQESLEKYLPEKIRKALSMLDETISQRVEEIRLRAARPLMVYTCDQGMCVGTEGKNGKPMRVGESDINQIFRAITGKSAYAYQDEIRQGFLTLENGIRAGLAGSATLTDGSIRTYQNISGINFRIPRQMRGIAERLLPFITTGGRLVNTLIVSSPGQGKTTLARDIARSAGSGIGVAPCKVSLIDERQELAASVRGKPLFDVGDETDVISNVLKHTGVFMALRALSPDVIVTDEIGKSEDLEALREVANSGVTMIATAHASGLTSLLNRLFFRAIIDEALFDRYVVLSATLGRITIEQIHDRTGNSLLKKPLRLMPAVLEAVQTAPKEAV